MSCLTTPGIAQWLDLSSDRLAVDFSSNGNVGFMGGSRSTLMKTEDAGKTWQNMPPPFWQGFTVADIRVTDDDGERVFFVVNDFYDYTLQTLSARIFKSEDGGKTWTSIFDLSRTNIEVYFMDENRIWVTSFDPENRSLESKTWRTIDGGVSWTEVNELLNATHISFHNDQGWALVFGEPSDGNPSKVLRSNDAGETWSIVKQDLSSYLGMGVIFAVDDEIALIIRYNDPGEFIRTTDGGTTWTTGYLPHTRYVMGPMSIHFSRETQDIIWLVRGGLLYKSTDAGNSWIYGIDAGGYYERYRRVKFFKESVGVLLGANGYFASTTDGGQTWQRQNFTLLNRYQDVYVKGDDLYALTNEQLLKASGGTATWDTVKNVSLRQEWDVNFLGDTGVVAGANFLMSTDGGSEWENKPKNWLNDDLFGSHLVNIYLRGQNVIWVSTGDGKIRKSTDGGASFVIKKSWPSNAVTTSHALIFQDDYNIWAIRDEDFGGIRSRDGGESWETISESVGTMFFLTPEIGWKVSYVNLQLQLFKTIDGGLTWKTMSEMPRYFHRGVSIHFADEFNGWCFSSDRILKTFYKTTDGGKTWQHEGAHLMYGFNKIHFETTQTGKITALAGGPAGLAIYRGSFTPVAVIQLAAPDHVTAEVNAGRSISLTWSDNSSNEDGFYIQRKDNSGEFVTIAWMDANTTTFTDDDILPDKQVSYRVASYIKDRTVAYSENASVDYNIAEPLDVSAIANSFDAVHLSWTYSGHAHDGFVIERSTWGSNFVEVGTIDKASRSHVDRDVVPAMPYGYRIRAYVGIWYSNYSETVFVTTPLPSPPDGLVAYALSSTEIKLAWTSTAEAVDGFIIERKAGAEGFFSVGKVPASQFQFIDSNLQPGTTYHYRMQSYTRYAKSEFAAVVTADTHVLPDSPPAAPSNFRVGDIDGFSLLLSWSDNSPDEKGFSIYRSFDGANFSFLESVTANTTLYTDVNVTPGVTYAYRLTAFNDHGISQSVEAIGIIAITSVHVTEGKEVEISPNPVQRMVTIGFNDFKVLKVEFMTAQGTQVEAWDCHAQEDAHTFDLGHLSPGLYFVRISSKHAHILRKILKR